MQDQPLALDERALWAAVLIQSSIDLMGINLRDGKKWENKAKRDARAWFEDDVEAVGSFTWTCQHLDIDPARFRRSLFELARTNPNALLFMHRQEAAGHMGARRQPVTTDPSTEIEPPCDAMPFPHDAVA